MKMFDAGKTKMIGLPYGEKNCDNMLSRFHLIPERYGQTDGRTEILRGNVRGNMSGGICPGGEMSGSRY